MKFTHPKKLRFKCVRCAICCGDTKSRARTILMLKIEAEKIAEKAQLRLGSFAEEVEGFGPYAYKMLKTADGKCIFLNKHLCTIYAYRPLICQFYPFALKETSSGTYAFAYTKECPGIGEGKPLKREFFEKLFRKFKKLMSENIKNNKE